MTAQLRKEARALAPAWAGTLAAVAVLGSRGEGLAWFSYCCGCALLGGLSFGHELQHRTLPMLLTQPVSRAAIWRDKVLVLAAALLTATPALAGALAASGSHGLLDGVVDAGPERVRILPFVPLCILCGAPLLALLTQSVLGGAILSLAVPGMCLTLSVAVHLLFPSLGTVAVTSTLVLIYLPVAFAGGYLQFRAQQARPLESRALSLPWSSPARAGPLAALLGKELRLQYGTVALAAPLWGLFFLGGILSRVEGGDWPAVATAVTTIVMLILPLVAGAVTLGEERSMGVADWQLTLPPPARQQWLAKMLVTLPLSLLFGLAVPLLVARPRVDAEVLVVLVVGHLLFTHLAIYAGSLTRGTVPAILLALGFWSAVGVALSPGVPDRYAARWLMVAAMAALLVLLHAFAFSNFRQGTLRPRRIGFQGAALAGLVAAFAAASAAAS